MRMRVLTVLVLGLGVGTIGAQNHSSTASQGQMEGMDMGQSATPAKPADNGAGMDMTHCGGMGHCMGMGSGKTAIPDGVLRVSFAGKSTDWTLAKLVALPHKTVTVHNEHAKADQTYSGVLLIDLLTRLGVSAKPHGKDSLFYIVANGSDGYETVYSLGEINPDVHDATVIVADAQDGKPLTTEGPFKMVATRETRPARWVRNLVSIRVLAAQ